MISVCVATYNGEKYIAEQLRSILCQLGPADEVVVSDDGSTDSTLSVVASLADNRVRIVHSTAHYFKWNFYNALCVAKGDIIFLSDQDDVWLEGKVARCLTELETYDLVCHNSRMVDEQLRPLKDDFFRFYGSGPGLLKNAINNTYFGSCMAFRRSVWEASLPWPKTNEIGHDIWLGLVAEMTGKTRFIDTPYLLYRRLSESRTNLSESLATRSRRPLWVKLWSRVVVLYEVMKYMVNIRFWVKITSNRTKKA